MKLMPPSLHTTRWFYVVVSVITFVVFFWMIKSFLLALITAGVFAVILSPVQRRVQRVIKGKRLSALVIVIGVFCLVFVPAFIVGIVIAQQAGDIVTATTAQDGWLQTLAIEEHPVFLALPDFVQTRLLAIDFVEAGKNVADWAFKNLGDALTQSARLMFNTLIFFVSLFYFLVYREELRREVTGLSPFRDKLDKDIIDHIVKTIRDVMFGALILAFIQAVLAAIGLSIFGVPGALFWGALVIIAAQIPMLGVGLIMVPAVLYLAFTGEVGSAVGLAIWAVTAVGLSDNILSPIIIGGRTKMPELLILISILGGLSVFGAIGFIVGPTVLAMVLVLLNLYKQGILERGRF